MEERTQAAMAGRREAFGEKQGGHGVEARIVQTIHPGIGMAAVEQQAGLREGFVCLSEALLDEHAGLGGHNTTPSRSTCCVNGMAR
jgi:hypothetical protein